MEVGGQKNKNRTWILFNFIIIMNYIGSAFMQQFKTEPTDIRVDVGESANLYCQAQELTDGQTLGWMRDQERITKNTRLLVDLNHLRVRLDIFGYILAFNVTRPSDANRYACAIFEEGTIYPIYKSDYAELEVWQKPSLNYPECSSSSKDYRFIEGSRVILNCIAEFLMPSVTLQWFYNGEPVDFGSINVNNDLEFVQSRFSFEVTKIHNLAEFTCRLTTEFDTNIVQICTAGPLEIDFLPTVHIEPVFATAGDQVYMFCNSTGNPEPFIHTWHFDPDIEQELYDIDPSGRNLRLYSPRTRMNGTIIECVAYNTAGYAKDQSILIVQGIDPPEDEFKRNGKVTPVESGNDDNFSSIETNTVAIIFLIVGIFSVIIVFFAVIPVCFRPACREVMDVNGHKIPQPDVYFEPKDRVLPPVPSEEQYASWRRSVAVQVSDTGGDLDSTYAEVMEEIEDKELSIIYSRKSIYI
ncbi:cell adhesion molecule 3-like [Antedon mediterranea]|uniref:cell adhesion molecule 3-like n=1 Tax=Antedon mediterranea TaxID=105859 RepID=UPI003AF6E6C9